MSVRLWTKCLWVRVQLQSFKQIPLSTLPPDSWTKQKTASYFNVKLYSVRKAASLKKEQGILPKVPAKKDTSLMIILQILWNNFMKMMNTQECALVQRTINLWQLIVLKGRNKRLLLANIKELYLEFWKKYINNSQENDNPKIHIRCLNFFSLRPKWVVTASDSCMNVCAIHQNVKLMMHAIPSNDTYKNLLEKLVCDISSCACMMKQYDKCHRIIKL